MGLEGQRLGEFEIIERIGQGGMGAVYKAVQTSLQRTVAIKTLQPALAADPEYIERFHREAIAAAGLSHQNLVQVYAAGETDGIHWFAMELVKGESAQVRLKRKGYIEPGEAIAIGVHLANALDYAWSRARLIHRDIKPDNIFLSGDGDVKLGDLGLAKMAEQTEALTVTGASMGTPYYVSPEQAEGRKDIDLRADIYSLGCTLYRLVSGQPPFSGDNPVTVMMKHVTSPPPDIRSVFPACPPVLAEVILKMMQKDPAARQQSYEEVNADLRRAFDELSATAVPVVSPRVVAGPRPVAVAKKGGVPAAAWVAGAVALIAAIAMIYVAPWKKGDAAPGTTNPAVSQAAGQTKVGAGGASAPTMATPVNATMDAPFVNTLGMKFVPVPILGGPTGGKTVLFSVWDTRVQDYEDFVKETKRRWSKVDFEQGPTHPAVGVSWEDAQVFCQWLTAREQAAGRLPAGFSYRLPSDHEWSCAVELGAREDAAKLPAEKNDRINDVFPWGTQWPPPKGAGNYAGEELQPALAAGKFSYTKGVIAGYNDGFVNTSPVGSFRANRLGLYDMGGSVQQWCEDWFDKDQKDRVLRGASWHDYDHGRLLSSNRGHGVPGSRGNIGGFRCVVGVSAR
jgi:hypothetical protein